MDTPLTDSPSWSTSSFGHTADTSPMELTALGMHLDQCRSVKGRLFYLRCAAEALHAFVAGRFVTTLVVAGLLMGTAYLIA